jgi:ribosomal protein S20
MKRTILILFLFCIGNAQAQRNDLSNNVKDSAVVQTARDVTNKDKLREIFKKVEKGIKTGKVEEYEKEINNLVSIAIGSNEQGYYSTNQALSILVGYFSERRSISFDFTKIHETGTSPYATGRFVYLHKGVQESAQIYVSLTLQDSIWLISQFNIY